MLSVTLFNVARYLTDSLRGPVLQTLRRARSASLMGRVGLDGLDGWDCHQKCPLIFFILRYNKHYTHIYLYIYKKIVPTNFFWVLHFGQVGGPDKKNQKHPLGMIF